MPIIPPIERSIRKSTISEFVVILIADRKLYSTGRDAPRRTDQSKSILNMEEKFKFSEGVVEYVLL